jgi:hypothetical protein
MVPRKPSERRTPVGRKPEAVVAGRDVCALVADLRFATQPPSAAEPSNEVAVGAATAEGGDATEDATRDDAANRSSYQETTPRDRRAQQDKSAQDNPALLHRAPSSAPDADAHVGERPPDRRP